MAGNFRWDHDGCASVRSPRASLQRFVDVEWKFQRFADAEKAFPVPSNHFPVPPKIFAVRLRREFRKKGQLIQAIRAVHQSQKHPESRKFPVFSLGIREFPAENGSLVTAPSAN
jgi:hypothetical protein